MHRALLTPESQEYENYKPKHREGIEFMRMLVLHFMDRLAEHDSSSAASLVTDIRPI